MPNVKIGILYLIFSTASVFAQDHFYFATKSFIKEINLTDKKKTTLRAVNYHPKFYPNGEVEYTGYKIKDIIDPIFFKKNSPAIVLGKTSTFSVEIPEDIFLEDDVILATHLNGKRIPDNESGNQIIYGKKAIQKYPFLKKRQFWCWWAKAIILDEEYPHTFRLKGDEDTFQSILPIPTPYGISYLHDQFSQRVRKGTILNIDKVKEIELESVSGQINHIKTDPKLKYVLIKNRPLANGIYSLHEMEIDGKVIKNTVNSYFYLRRVEVKS